jgi:hypothetical protein
MMQMRASMNCSNNKPIHSYAWDFPGNNPVGLLATPDYQLHLATLGEHTDVTPEGEKPNDKWTALVQEAIEWYAAVTEDSTNYDNACFQRGEQASRD